MKTPQLFIVMLALACAGAASAIGASFPAETVLQNTDFGPEDGYAPGSVDGQRGWTTVGVPATIGTSRLSPERQALLLAAERNSWAMHPIAPSLSQAIQADIVMELHVSSQAGSGSRLGMGGMDIGFILTEAGVFACVEYPGAADMTVFPQLIPADSEGGLGLSHIGILIDDKAGRWSLTINGLAIAEQQPLVDAGGGGMSLMLSAGEAASAEVASVSIREVPSFDDTGTPGDPGGGSAKGGAGAVPVTLGQKQASHAAAAMGSPDGSGSPVAPLSTPANNTQPAFFTVFSPN